MKPDSIHKDLIRLVVMEEQRATLDQRISELIATLTLPRNHWHVHPAMRDLLNQIVKLRGQDKILWAPFIDLDTNPAGSPAEPLTCTDP